MSDPNSNEENEPKSGSTPPLAELLERYPALVPGLVRRHGGALLRLEGADDLAQGARLKALGSAATFEYRSEEEFRAWLTRVVRGYLADRHAYWSAARRDAGSMLRLTNAGGLSELRGAAPEPAAAQTGPLTFAERSEQLALAAQAIRVLLPRDQRLVQWMREELPLLEIAERLEISYDAAERARLRAMERFRQAYELLAARS